MEKMHSLIAVIRKIQIVTIIGLLALLVGCTKSTPKEIQSLNENVVESKISEETLWHVKAIHPEGRFLDIKAVDAYGNTFDINATQDPNQKSCMDIKAFVSGKISLHKAVMITI